MSSREETTPLIVPAAVRDGPVSARQQPSTGPSDTVSSTSTSPAESSSNPNLAPVNQYLLYVLAFVLFLFTALHSFKPYEFARLVDPDAPKTALLLTAHPDDEAMFFSPTILGLVKQGWKVRGLCLSIGNESGLGATRSSELLKSYASLGVPSSNVQSLDDIRFQDGMQNHWNVSEISNVLVEYLREHPVSLAITFDHVGITQHPNHTPLPLALIASTAALASASASASNTVASATSRSLTPRILTLVSPGVAVKFTGPLYPLIKAYLSHFLSTVGGGALSKQPKPGMVIDMISSPLQWAYGISAMLQHRSQLVWFRWLYLLFSRLMWLNELVLVV